ncbi:hypothetical protein V511_07680 [Mesotoga sp. Brook.08.YT.4.2.5.1]|uniref:hypothetical protein n=1 Tax=unclassified Mesotoga TaxID=1184398 RepID=UPI000C193FAA|nr:MULTISPECIES: hypothetical protein [unclassified Mesotoga]PNE22428.1 hypothetical protein V511_07680 [Mesotoga sp. Brook.08.YT.4.2.5.1]PNS40268.1 hypothetical protein RJ60_07520 [Mesotoga sp. B105.6.4]PVD15661.1 hypothetical protein V512_001700 [Mesotoga sp. Brook.08.105.5.1]RAO98216.1 hypothetical protein M388_07725 [Mesotoga sp. Brook.08.YT.4.2.5.4.]RDI93168.1 hypothetical protein Q502_07935 [Mesotoga sp. Brook.08.YT.4.2.5.2.]
MKKFSVLLILIVLIASSVFSQRLLSQDSAKFISIVTDGTFNNFPDVPIGEAFDSFFEMSRWKHLKEGTQNIVEFSGSFADEYRGSSTVLMRFSVVEEDSTFTLSYWEINGVPQDNSGQYAFLERIFLPDRAAVAISIVRDGFFYEFPDRVIGESFSSFFADSYWDYFLTSDNLDVVEFSGFFYSNDELVEALFQFIVNVDERTFEIAYLGVDDVTQDDTLINTLLNSIFASKITDVKNSYFDVYYNWMTLGEAFDSFFYDPYWDYFLSTDDLDIVEFYGTFDLGGIPAEVYCQFEVYDDGSYDLYYWEIDGYYESINAFYLLLELIYY